MTESTDTLRQFRLDGMVAAITGGARGIGRATAAAFTQAGARVAIMDRDAVEAKSAAAAIGDAATAYELDVTDEKAVDSIFDDLVRTHGHIDVLVNNAGVAIRHPTTELSLADWQKVLDVNMTGVFLCARAAGRHMVARRSGVIVNTASIMGLSGGGIYPNISYQATKGAVVNMTRALAVEWARHGVRVNAIAPTWVNTDFIAALKTRPELMDEIRRLTPLGRLVEPHEIAASILFLSSPAAAMITGHVLVVDGGFLAQ